MSRFVFDVSLNKGVFWIVFFKGTIILPVMSDGWETWVCRIKRRRRLRLFENWVLTKEFGLKGEKITGNCRKSLYEELCDLGASQNII